MVEPPITVASAPYVLIPLASIMTGLSEKAIRRKIEEAVWIEGREYIRAADGHVYISIKGYTAWVEKGLKSGKPQSGSRSRSTESSNAVPC